MSSELNNFSKREKYARKNVLNRNNNKMRREEDFKKYDDLNFRFKSSVELNMKDGDENEAVVANAIVVDARKEAAVVEEREEELRPSSADAGTEYSYGFLLWSFMHFGADNALVGHSGNWQSKEGVDHDFWSARFDGPVSIDTVEIHWKVPPKRMKIFYKLNESKDWIGATEVFIKEELKDGHGNAIPPTNDDVYYSIYFKKSLMCQQFKIMMNQPVKKKTFSIYKVGFFNKINNGIIKAPLIDANENNCWYVNSNLPRVGVPIYAYPCIDGISVPIGTGLFSIFPNHQIKPYKSDMCVGFDPVSSNLMLSECQDASSASEIYVNDDYTMYFKGKQSSPISIDTIHKNVNMIGTDSDVTVSSEADKTQYKKENLLDEGNSVWQSSAGDKDVTIQIHFGRVKCKDCNENGKFEAQKVDSIRIKWAREPTKFSVFLWHPGHSWKQVASFDNNIEKVTNISVIQDTASAIMIRISDGNKFDEFEKQVVYSITSIATFFNGSKLIIKDSGKVTTQKKYFDFESQAVLYKEIGNNWDTEMKLLGKRYEKSIATYKIMKKAIPSAEIALKTNKDLNKKLERLNDQIKSKETDRLLKFEKEQITKIKHNKFYKYLNQYAQIEKIALENILGIKTDDGNDDVFNVSKSNPLKSLTSLLNKKEKDAQGPKTSPEKPKRRNEEEGDISSMLGSFEEPATNCMNIKLINKTALSGYYYIEPECSDIPIRVFCDFALHEIAVDIHIYKAGSNLNTPVLTYLHLKTAEDVRDECAKIGLVPIEVRNKEMVQRIQDLLVVSGMDITYPHFVPLGYDYSCNGVKCADIFNSINKKASDPIMNFFDDKSKAPKKPKTSYQFVGLSDPIKTGMSRYNEKKMEITGLICSTNITNEKQETKKIKVIDCAFTLNANLDIFATSKERVVICPKGCIVGTDKVFGSGTYNGKSPLCKAAIHSGNLAETGGKVVIHIDKPQTNYAGTVANGVNSSVMPSDGSKSFLVFKYKPDCPKKNKKNTSFIAQEENMFLDNERILDDAMGIATPKENKVNKDIEINNLIDNMGKYNNKRSIKNKKDLITDQLIPELSLATTKDKNLLNHINMEKYRFSQKNKLKALENTNTKFPSLPSVPSLPSLPGGLNSGSLTDAANTAKDLAGAGKDALGDLSSAAKSMFGSQDKPEENKPGEDGKYKAPVDLMPNSLSEPSLPRSFNWDERKNILPAMSKGQSRDDPNTLDGSNKPNVFDDPKAPTVEGQTAGADKPEIAPLELPGKKKGGGPSPTDLSMAGKKGPDPLETIPDNEDEKKDDEEINKDIPSNSKKGGENTQTGKRKLRKIYNSGYFAYLKTMAKRFQKISDAIGKFIELNMPLFGNKNLDLEYCESTVCFYQGANITNMPDVYDILLEKGQKLQNLIRRLLDRINARIYKTEKIKESWTHNYALLTAQDCVKVDYSIYPTGDIAADRIFTEIFEEQKIGNEVVLNAAKWELNERGVKNRPRVMGIEFLPTDTTNGSSNIILKEKLYYDFNLKFDVLLAESGTVSINFRQADNFNYYSFIIDKTSGNKIFSKNINGNMEIIHTINDGAIGINQWHTVEMTVLANKIKIVMYDSESTTRSVTEKIIEVFDSSFVKGTMGFNVNGVTGVYFDNFEICPITCWSPWQPKKPLQILNANANVYEEDFSGNFEEKYEKFSTPESSSFIELGDAGENEVIRDGPAIWSFQDGGTFEQDFILQETKVWDSSPRKKPNFVILNDKNFHHGTFVCKFKPMDDEGIISIMFKFIHENLEDKYYVFELNNERKEPSFDLKYIAGDQVKPLGSKLASDITDFNKKAYKTHYPNMVEITVINDKLSIKVQQDDRELFTIFNVDDQTLMEGRVGFGTYKTATRFTTVRMYQPNLKMTPNDIDKVLTVSPSRLFSSTAFPSPKKINDVYVGLAKKFLPFGYHANEDIKSEISAFASSLGYHFRKDSLSADPSGGADGDKNGGGAGGPGGKNGKEGDLASWKKCIMARSSKDRSTWCDNSFASEFLKKKCEVKFCDTCCENSIATSAKNTIHMCKKGCFRGSISVENNKEYKNVCITSPNNVQNIYNYCDDKMTSYKPIMMNYCKLDMCNLCCVAMDTIKNKNYSVPNMKACFKDCAKSYNVVLADKEVPTSQVGDVPKPDGEECLTPPNINLRDLNSEDKFPSNESDEDIKNKKSFMAEIAKNKAKENEEKEK